MRITERILQVYFTSVAVTVSQGFFTRIREYFAYFTSVAVSASQGFL